jgi:glutaredoxin-related protein
MEKINGRMKTDEEHCYEKIKSFVEENEKMNLQYTQAYIKESMKDFEEIMDAELDGF